MPPEMKMDPSQARMGDSHLIVDIVRECGHDRPEFSGVEVGCWRGGTSAKLLEAFPNLLLFMVDSWSAANPNGAYAASGDGCARISQDEHDANRHAAIAATERFGVRRAIHRMTSVQACGLFLDGAFDFVFLDGDHTYRAVKLDIALWLPKIAPGGILAGHDYGHPRNARGLFGVNQAVDEFCEQSGSQLLRNGSCWYCRR